MEFQTFSLTVNQSHALEHMDPGSNRCAVFRLEGPLDTPRLLKAIKDTLQRCAPFSYKCMKIDGGLQILLSPDREAAINVIDVDDDASVFPLINNYQRRVFRLDGGAPYLFCLLRSPQSSHLVFVCHPWLIDRFSLTPLFNAITRAYNGDGDQSPLGLSQQVLLEQEKTRLDSPQHAESMRFWLQVLHDSGFEWRPARVENDLSDNYFNFTLSTKAQTTLAQVAAKLTMPPDELLLLCFHLFLYRMTRNETVLTKHCHRIRSGQADQIGFNENKPLLRSQLDPAMSVADYLRAAHRFTRQTKYHADMPSGMIAPELLRLDPGTRWPSNILFDEDTLPYHALKLDGVAATLLPHFSHRLESEDIALYFEAAEQIRFHVLARAQQEIPGLKLALAHYQSLIENLGEGLELPIGELCLSDRAQQDSALALASGGRLLTPATDVLARFVALCDSQPQAPAVRCGERTLDYRALSLSAGSIATHLAPLCASKRDALVGICQSRSERMIQSVFGVLAADAGYLPLDPAMPAERLRFIVEDAKLTAVIADAETFAAISEIVECPVLQVEQLLDAPCLVATPQSPSDCAQRTAYVIYTSGTTGKPKGVVIERGMLANFVASLEGRWQRGPGSRWLQFASLNFDASVLEIFNPLAHGAELIITASETRTDPQAIYALLQSAHITHCFLPPAMLRLLPRQPLPELQSMCCGGEALDEESVRFWSKTLELANIYGPTEATVMATFNQMGGFKSANQLGRPSPGYFTYILNSNGTLAPQGGVGEICIGGSSVARGYLGRPELTAQKFEANPFAPGQLYHSGDLGRFMPNGELEFLGRCDFQVKIRGFRIELGDIEHCIADQAEVSGCYVGVFDRPNGKTLMAWYIAKGLTPEVLRSRLAAQLPQYMIPTFLLPLDHFPLNIGGKIDRTRLPQPENKAVEALALDELGQQIRAIWATALNLPSSAIGANSHFFHLGGHSLIAALVCNRLNALLAGAVRPKILFEHPEFADFCEQVRATPRDLATNQPLVASGQSEAVAHNRIIPLIYSRAMRVPTDNTYNIVLRIDFAADMHPVRLRKVFGELLAARPEFRIALEERGDQIWIKATEQNLPVIPLLDTSRNACEARAESMRADVLGVSQAPLWRAEIHCLEDGTTTLLFNVHHAIFDGWSLNLLLEELGERYAAALANQPYSRERLSWFDYNQWAGDIKRSQAYQDGLAYWKNKLSGIDSHVELPADFRQKQDNANQWLVVRFAPETVAALKTFADQQEVTLSPLLFSLWLAWLWRISGQTALACAYPYAGRDVAGSEDIFGMFVTMGVLSQTLQPKQTLGELVRSVHHQMLEDKDHLITSPYEADLSNLDRLNTVFSLQSGIGLEGEFGGVHYQAEELPSLTSKSDLTGIFYQSNDGSIAGRIEFDSSVFKAETMASYIEVFNTLVQAAAQTPSARLDELSYQSEADRAHIMALSCGAPLATPDSSIPARFAGVVQRCPDQLAVVFGTQHTSFRQLDEWSSRIAAGLALHVQPGSRIGLSMQKSDTLVACVLAILKLGCAYVPLDPSYPADRLRFFAENAAVTSVLADELSRVALCEAGLAALDYVDPATCEQPALSALPAVTPDAMAYIIHTSGSTGQPKGVMIEHRSVVRLIDATSSQIFAFEANSICSLVASLNFDASVIELFSALLNGLTLVVVSETDRKSPPLLHQALLDNQVSHVTVLSPVILQNLPRLPLPSLKMIGFGGDTVDEQTAEWWAAQTRLFTVYGPTETTVLASSGLIVPGGNSRVIGKPLAGYRLYLLNPGKQLVPMGAVGEICIGGGGLARGYLNRDDLTLERFVLDPFGDSPYDLMYMTGDLGRFLPDGTIEFFGRNDAQVKVRGFRIELGEIENRLGTFPGIEHVCCATKGEGDNRYLAAYYVAASTLDEEQMRQHIGAFLPDYMIPAFFVKMAALPASPSGKIDRRILPEMSGKDSTNPPHDGMEAKIAAIWETILRFRGIGRDESFFRVGGNSLLAVRMQTEVQKQLGLEFTMAEFYGAPTIEAIAAGKQTDYIQMASRDARAPVSQLTQACDFAVQPAHTVLLTGASGFLGGFLLAELSHQVEQVICLQRGKDAADGLASIRKQAELAGLDVDWTRVEVVNGDLASPSLGLSTASQERLAREVDAILHCGAFVHHLHNYQTMKAANVDSTEALLQLALQHKKKAFCLVSTLSVPETLAGLQIAPEDIVENQPFADIGYTLTKWTAEQRVARYAAHYGLNAVIARAGNITGCSRTGYSNYAHNHFWLFNKGCIQLGAYPETPARIEMTPVDVLAHAISALLLAPRQGLAVRNLSNPLTISMATFFGALAAQGFSLQGEVTEVWQQRLQGISEDNGLAQIKEFYTGDLSAAPLPTEQRETLEELHRLGAELTVDYNQLLPIYVGYLRSSGFLQ